ADVAPKVEEPRLAAGRETLIHHLADLVEDLVRAGHDELMPGDVDDAAREHAAREARLVWPAERRAGGRYPRLRSGRRLGSRAMDTAGLVDVIGVTVGRRAHHSFDRDVGKSIGGDLRVERLHRRGGLGELLEVGD